MIDGRLHVVAASIGIARPGSRASCPVTLLREAETALYAAKAAGKARTEIYRPSLEHQHEVVLPDVVPREAIAWASYMRELRIEIADRKHAGQLSSQTRAPATVHRTLEQVLAAIDHLTDDTTTSTLELTGRQALEEFVFHQTAVQHWADALTVRGQLTTRRPPDADRFWHELETRVVSP